MSILQVALAQTKTTTTPEENLKRAEMWVREAFSRRAEILILPEMFMARPKSDETPAIPAEPVDGPFLSRICDLAASHRMYILVGAWEAVPGETRVYNIACLADPDGKTAAVYRKIHLFDALNVKESDRMLPGNAPPPIVDILGVKTGIAICYDLRFPELFRYFAANGADAVLVPSAWYAGPLKEDHWLTLLRARAIENTLYIAGCNLTGDAFSGRSTVFDPFGVPVAGAGESEMLVTAWIDTDRIAAVREKLPALSHRRPDLFAG